MAANADTPVLTINELMRLTRTELCGLPARISAELPTSRGGSPRRTAAYITDGRAQRKT
jgi:hypothetical protein